MRISDWSSDVCSSDLDYISTPKRNGYRSLHTTVIHQDNARIEVQIRSRDMHHDAELGLAAHWAYKQKGDASDHQAAWLRDLVEILEQSQDADELLEHTRSEERRGGIACVSSGRSWWAT